MVTGRVPTETSLTILLSNMRLSFGISISSKIAIRTWIFARCAAQPPKPSPGILVEPRDHNSNVVRAAAFVREGNKFFRRSPRVGLGLQRSCNFRFRDHARQSIGTEQQNIARKERVLLCIHFDFRLRAKRAQQNALHVAFFGLGGGQYSTPHLFGNQRVIPCKLQQAATAKQISAAVAHVSDAETCAIDPHGRESRAHTVLLRDQDRKSTRLNSSHPSISYAVFCLKKKKNK